MFISFHYHTRRRAQQVWTARRRRQEPIESTNTTKMSPMLSAFLIVALTMTVSSANKKNICTTNSECSPNFCCLLGPSRFSEPICMPVLQEGEQCRVNADTVTTNLTYPDNSQLEVKDIYFILCPCADGLACNPRNGICT